ncbi:hypothetical protein [Streptomyces sp. NPDC088746]|uniref:hypothetical protein n=1 Tax=Streptomyces sp. NPDC088746 TaxID=3365885 RepID=UPI0038179C5C
MRSETYQVGSRTCGCIDCVEEYPTAQHGPRPRRDTCSGPWRARYRTADGKHRQKTLSTRADAVRFLRAEGADHGA